ncbi:MAG: anthranilate phosphoribosyltransferase [Blastochloris sp.]|nr:anthranilate phosphoribosyltransferase [Blastochloris sp.]
MTLLEATGWCGEGRDLEPAMVPALVEGLLDARVTDGQKVDFLRALSAKGESDRELAAFARALLPRAVHPGVEGQVENEALFDCCGTGGGGLNLVNLSTAMMPVLAACGVPVVKHGNRGVTKKSGSADVLEALGSRIDFSAERVPEALGECGMVFLMAPQYHPAFRHVAAARKQLAGEGKRSIFNLLGPLLNPSRPATQLLGVFQRGHLELFQRALRELGRERFLVVCGLDGDGSSVGEVSVTGKIR